MHDFTDDLRARTHMVGESRFGGITRGGFFGLMLVGGLVVGLFFIPELLQFQKNKSNSNSTASSPVVSPQRAEIVASLDTSPMTDFSSSDSASSAQESTSSAALGWWNDLKRWFDGISAPKLHKPERSGSRYAGSGAGSVDGRASLGMVSQRLDGPRAGHPTWETIRSQESRDAAGQAKRDALELALGLPSSARNARFAMIDFANGLEFVMTRGEQQMTPRDAINYLAKLDQTVSRALAEDKVERVFVKRWSQISLGPVLGRTIVGQRHDLMIGAFDPQLTITALDIQHIRMRNGDPRTGRVKVTMSGYMIGDDIKRAFLEANEGGVLRKVSLQRDPRGYWFFNRGSLDGRLKWTFKVYDKFGERYEKTYEFFPRARSFPLQGSSYRIPFKMAQAKVGLFRGSDYDPKLDRFFMTAARQEQGEDPNGLFVSF